MSQSFSKFIIEIFFAVLFAIAVIFLVRIYSMSGSRVTEVNTWTRQGNNIKESTSVETDETIKNLVTKGNVVEGSSLYYDILASASDILNGNMIIVINSYSLKYNDDSAMNTSIIVKNAVEGDPSGLLELIDQDASYLKIYGTTYEKTTEGEYEETKEKQLITYKVN